MTWVEGSKGRSPIIKYVIEGNNETGFANDRTSQWFIALTVDEPYKIYNLPPVLIENLRPNTVYRFRVRAYNKVGASPLSLVSKDIKTGMARKFLPQPMHTHASTERGTIANKFCSIGIAFSRSTNVNNRCCFINAEQHCWNNNEQHCSLNNIVEIIVNNNVRSTTLLKQ